MEDNIQLSVIIPVYNTEDYLVRCVDSVLANKGINMEIILVDDGSTDSSPVICDRYSARYPFVKTLHVDNSGPATAKNHGLNIASGQYIAFTDSDDEVKNNMFVRMLEVAEQHEADIVCCNYEERLPNGEYCLFNYTGETLVLDNYSGLEHFLMKKKIYTQCWTKIYRRHMLEHNNIRNVEGLKTDEDFIFNINCFVHAQKTCVVDSPLYIYTIRETSLSKDYFNKDINAYIDNRLLHFDIVDDLLNIYSPANRRHAVFSRLYYSNELLGRIARFPACFSDPRIRYVIKYMRRHLCSLFTYHKRIGVSVIGIFLFFLPAGIYMRYRHGKVAVKM